MIRSQSGKEKYDRLVRLCAGVISLLFMYISAQFAKDGFSLDVPDRDWIGWALAFGLIVIEIVWNKKGAEHGVTLYLAGFIAYAYGIYTNIVGINYAAGNDIRGLWNFLNGLWMYPISTFVGLMLELVPEPLLIWALTGESKESDPVKNMMDYGDALPKPKEDYMSRLPKSVNTSVPNYKTTLGMRRK